MHLLMILCWENRTVVTSCTKISLDIFNLLPKLRSVSCPTRVGHSIWVNASITSYTGNGRTVFLFFARHPRRIPLSFWQVGHLPQCQPSPVSIPRLSLAPWVFTSAPPVKKQSKSRFSRRRWTSWLAVSWHRALASMMFASATKVSTIRRSVTFYLHYPLTRNISRRSRIGVLKPSLCVKALITISLAELHMDHRYGAVSVD